MMLGKATLTILVAGRILAAQDGPAIFRAEASLVEVTATVLDQKGRLVRGLKESDFRLKDNGAPQKIIAFEADERTISCAILLDVTGSMTDTLPRVKNAVGRFIDEFRPGDSIAVYSFNETLRRLVDFTSDRGVAKQAVLRTRAAGGTALFDAMSLLARDLAGRKGKKAIVVFTDGDDNASLLSANSAVQRAKRDGFPVYAVAEGAALKSNGLLRRLAEISEATGGHVHEMRTPKDITTVFDMIAEQLQHTYFLAYRPTPGAGWHKIDLLVGTAEGYRVRSRQGYLVQ